ncbi:MAG: hypothetical protein IMZ61_03265 [Planctomycetes bacterium]|nr:hypothetical protein [Planctomycetota bacterium]
MSQRPYRIHDDIMDTTPLFSIEMDWDAIEPFIINNDFGIEGFIGTHNNYAIMVIDVEAIRESLKTRNNPVLSEIAKSTKRNIATFEVS